ncbi:DUF4956 domain-containing protein [Nakamurella lactea]|uniref:DUF4956 domain-containing protein n=1 Tax=Nakamurella lactea TaxID=459515 RepID=UPI0004042A22|nr:DUF4956 domain-containing protein [Nakamurella lactea]
MTTAAVILSDLIAIGILAFGLYFPRHQRRDLLLALIALNVGVLAVASVLIGAEAGVGLGLGLFGVLSIIRLRSDQISQQETAYYFSALALGLMAGIRPDPWWLSPALSALLLAVVFAADHPWVLSRARRQTIVLDSAHLDERALVAELGRLLGARIRRAEVIECDLVRDVTVVDVRYRLPKSPASAPPAVPTFPAAGTFPAAPTFSTAR